MLIIFTALKIVRKSRQLWWLIKSQLKILKKPQCYREQCRKVRQSLYAMCLSHSVYHKATQTTKLNLARSYLSPSHFFRQSKWNAKVPWIFDYKIFTKSLLLSLILCFRSNSKKQNSNNNHHKPRDFGFHPDFYVLYQAQHSNAWVAGVCHRIK